MAEFERFIHDLASLLWEREHGLKHTDIKTHARNTDLRFAQAKKSFAAAVREALDASNTPQD